MQKKVQSKSINHVQSILKAKKQAGCANNKKTCETEDAGLPGHCLTAT